MIKYLTESGNMGFYQKPLSGSIRTYGMQVQTGSLPLETAKTSVDTGSFVPGVYRVNPYSVKSSNALMCIPKDVTRERTLPGPPYTAWTSEQHATLNQYIAEFTNRYVCWVTGEWWRPWLYNAANAAVPVRLAKTYEQLSLQKVYGKIRDADLPLGEDLGEIRQTLKMLGDPLSALKKFLVDDRSRNLRLLSALRRGDKWDFDLLAGRTGKASLDALTGTWLELRYGLRPLVMLVQNVIDEVTKQRISAFDPDKIRGKKSRLAFGPYVSTIDVGKQYSYTRIGAEFRVEETIFSTASVQYRQTLEQSFLDSLGLTPRFLPETMWQLTTLSFVWDWLISIGPWLASLRVAPDVEILGNTSGFRHTRKFTPVSSPYIQYGSAGYKQQLFSTEFEESYFVQNMYDRKVNLSLSYLPHFTWGRTLDFYKAVDSLSLIWQFAKNLKRN